MKLRAILALAPATLALAACGQEQQAPDGEMLTVDQTEDALATDTSVVPPQDTSGEAPPAVATPTPQPTLTTPVEPLPEADPDNRT